MTSGTRTSRWFLVSQDRIDAFADATEDWQFIHTDPVRAKESPFQTTIAHGFLSLSLLSAMYLDAGLLPPEARTSINYGFDRVRFVSPVSSGARVRGHFVLHASDVSVPGQVSNTWVVTVEIEGHDRPALIAHWLTRYFLQD